MGNEPMRPSYDYYESGSNVFYYPVNSYDDSDDDQSSKGPDPVREREQERQRELERQAREREEEQQRELKRKAREREEERQRELERQAREREEERQRELERQAREREEERQRELERQAREREEERQKELERQAREREEERQRELERKAREREEERQRELERQARERKEERQRELERQAREREQERQKHLARQKELEQQRERERKLMEEMKRREQEAKEEAARQDAIRQEEERRVEELRKLEELKEKKQEQFEYRLSQAKGISQKFVSLSLVHETVHIESHNPFKFSSKPLPDVEITAACSVATEHSSEETSPEDSDTELTEDDEDFKFPSEMTNSDNDEVEDEVLVAGEEIVVVAAYVVASVLVVMGMVAASVSEEEICPEVHESGLEFTEDSNISNTELAYNDETSSEEESEYKRELECQAREREEERQRELERQAREREEERQRELECQARESEEERQRELERQAREREEERQRELERQAREREEERQRQLERQAREREEERQRTLERQARIREKERQRELERQAREREEERQHQAREREGQQQRELERQAREREEEQQRELERQAREREEERQRQLECQAREGEEERQRMLERQAREREKERQHQAREREEQQQRELECQARESEEERQRELEHQSPERHQERQKPLARQKELEQQRERERKLMEEMKHHEQEAMKEAARQEAIGREVERRVEELRKLEEKKEEQFEYRLSQAMDISQKFIESEDEDPRDGNIENEFFQDEDIDTEESTLITAAKASRVSLAIIRTKGDEELDTDWLLSAQVLLLAFYAQQNAFSDLQTDILIEFLAQVLSGLSNEESLSLAKTVSSLGDIHPSAYPIPLDSDTPLQCKLAGLLIHCGNIYQNTNQWMQRCLLAFLPAVTDDDQLQHMVTEASSTIWSLHDWFHFLRALNSRSLSITVQKNIVHFIQTYRIQPEVVEAALAEDNVTNFLKEEVKSEMNKPSCDIMDEMRETELVDEAVLDQVEKIIRATVAMIDRRNINITLNYKSHLSDMTNVNHAKGIFRKLQHSDICYDELADAIITLMCAVQRVQGFHPRETQLVAFAILLLSSTTSTGRLLQMLTGEGKSCVIAMFAAALGLQSKQVDIVTSSPVLAVRDAEKWGEFFSIFDLKATHNTNIKKQLSDEEKTHCYQHPIVYGTVSNFSADILWQEFEQKQIRSNRRFDAVIVDEVDLLMLDEGVQFTYLSHNAAVLLHIEPVLATIWAIVGPFKAVATSSGSILYTGRPAPFTDIIFRCLDPQTYEVQDPSDLIAIARELNIIPDIPDDLSSADEETKRKVLSSIVSSVVPADALVLIRELDNYMDPPPMLQAYMANDAGLLEAVHTLSKDEGVVTKMILLLENGLACFLESQEDLRDGAIAKVKETLNFSDSASNDDKSQEDQIKLPSFLKKFVTDQIPTYVTNAIRALEMLENREYAISEDGRIIPVDYLNSGVMELNKKWGGGLQQMLEMKHGLCLSPLSLVTNFMSNIEFFSRYAQGNGCIYGLSGTLGLDTTTTTKVLRDLYEVQACSIPTHKVRKLYEKPTIIVQGEQKEWFERIVDALKEAVPSKEDGGDCLWKKRAVLILCEDIKTANSLRDYLLKDKKWEEKKVLLYAHSNSEEHSAINKSLEPGDIIIATNLAGRGTDIKVCEEVDHSGGLLCLLTFLPRNRRVELQAFGRTGRKGKPGSVQCILKASTLPLHCQELEISAIRRIREEEEALRLDQLVQTDVREVQLKEKLFKSYCQFLRGLHRDFETHASLSEELTVVVSSLNENWGQWLQMKAPQIERLEEEVLQQELCQACELWRPFIPEDVTSILHLPVTNFYHMIKFGNQLLIKHDRKNAEKACSYFTESIDLEKRYALIAYYNHAYCTIVAAKKGYKDKAKQDLEAAKACIDPYIFEVTSVLQLISVTNQARGTVSTPTKVKKEAGDFISQMQARVQILGFLKEKINEALEKIKQLGDDNIEVNPVGTFSLIPEPDQVTNKELALMWNLGLEVVYSVQKKPTFCYGGLICFCLGAAQILAGSLLTVCTVGTAASIGMALISEGISDCMTGAMAMATREEFS